MKCLMKFPKAKMMRRKSNMSILNVAEIAKYFPE